LNKAIVFLFSILLTACSGTGGVIGGLVPAPKFLKGDVEGDVYLAQDRDFRVALPHPPSVDGYEWTYTKVHESKNENHTKVIFGPAAFDINYYHVSLVNSTIKSELNEHSSQLFEKVTKMQPYRESHAPEQLVNVPITINGNSGIYAAFRMGPSQWLLCAVVYLNEGFYVIEADISRSFDGKYNPSEEEVKSRKYEIFNRLLESFEKPV
jgi:hypothetical protein